MKRKKIARMFLCKEADEATVRVLPAVANNCSKRSEKCKITNFAPAKKAYIDGLENPHSR